MTTPEKHAFIVGRLYDAYNKKYKEFKPRIEASLKPAKPLSKTHASKLLQKVEDKSKAAALLCEVLELINDKETGIRLSDVFEPFKLFEIQRPKVSSVQSFINILKKISNDFQGDVLLYLKDKARGRTCHVWKVSDRQQEWAQQYYSLPNKLKLTQILTFVNERSQVEGLPTISLSTLKNNILTRTVREMLYIKRYGLSDWRYNRATPVNRIGALYALDRLEVDASGISIPVIKNKTVFLLKLCIVVDCHSKMILGWSLDTSERGKMVVKAVKNALIQFQNPSLLPFELFTDRFPGHNGPDAVPFFDLLRSLGVHIRIESTGNARAKSNVENRFNVIGDVLKVVNDYLGKNITTTSKESRVSKEQDYKIKKRAKSEQEVVEEIRTVIHLHNITKGADGMSPQDRFKISERKNAITMTDEDRVKVFYQYRKIQANRGLITLKRGFARYHFEIKDEVSKLTMHSKEFGVRYQLPIQGDSKIYVYDLHSDILLFSCERQKTPHLALANQTDFDQRIYFKRIHETKRQIEIIRDNVESMGIAEDTPRSPELNLLNHLTNTKRELDQLKYNGLLSLNPDSANVDFDADGMDAIETDDADVEFVDEYVPTDDDRRGRGLSRLAGYDEPLPLEGPRGFDIGLERLE